MTRRFFHALAGTLSVLGISLLLAGCRQGRADRPTQAESNSPAQSAVRYVSVVEQAVPEILDLAAKVQPDPTKVVHIFAPASGRVISIAVRPGDQVRRGETVAALDSSDVASARSDYAKASIESDRALRAMEREKVLFEHGAAAEKDFIDARAQADSASAELLRAKQRLELLNVNPAAHSDQVHLVAPANGVVLDVSAAPGEFSKSLDSANPLITIADLNNVWVIGDVYEKDVGRLARGKPVTVTLEAYPGEQWKGHIDSLSGALDPTTRTLKIRVSLPNPGQRLKPEMFGTIHVNTGTHQALLVPVAAIVREGTNATVFVNHAGKPEQRTVTVGATLDGKVEVTSGLRPGDQVAGDGAELLKGGPGE